MLLLTGATGSIGSRLLHCAMRAARAAATELRDHGTYDALFDLAAAPVPA